MIENDFSFSHYNFRQGAKGSAILAKEQQLAAYAIIMNEQLPKMESLSTG